MNNIDKNFHINFSPLYAIVAVMFLMFVASELKADTQAKLGGTFVNINESAIFTASIDNKWETDLWQGTFEADYAYKREEAGETLNKFNTNGKLIKDLTSKHYAIAVASYDYDKFRTNNDRIVSGIGHGYKILRTERSKASIENSIAYLKSNGNNEPIIRSSLWYNFKMTDSITFNNKFLWE